jgi:diaminohydroxyphosphoribosylaminopyrimidine deaminase/5-amino-6-(5-phosphoribosylamino)uracil reductase
MLITDHKFTNNDAKHMARALYLAKQGIYSTTPNPHVGCVIVNEKNEVIGEGFHKKAGLAHAEIVALDDAASNFSANASTEKGISTTSNHNNVKTLKGATAYVTLEPCSHYGRTGPCAQALINAGIAKVIIACGDSNPDVAGKGVQMLVNAGVDVAMGLMEDVAFSLNRYFFFRLSHKRPFVTVKLAASLDGKTALANGESKWITSSTARKDVQKFRAGACAILSGADTVLADNPQLNVRPAELSADIAQKFAWRKQQPLRVIIDSQNRLNDAYQIFKDGQATLVYNLENNVNIDANSIVYGQKQIPSCKSAQREYVDLQALLFDLGAKGIYHLWVEAGATLTGALFDASLVDELVLYQAPKLLGTASRSLSNTTAPTQLSKAVHGHVKDTRMVGSDIRSRIVFGDK